MEIGILGADGFLGQALCKQFPDAVQITKGNYEEYRGDTFDVFINANGNSRKFWAEQNPNEDFYKSTASVMDTFMNFNIKHYVYISSTDVYGETVYGFHKRLAERIVKKHADSYLILRCCALIGDGMRKGVVKDLIDGDPLWVRADSKMQFITTSEVAKAIKIYIASREFNVTIDIHGEGYITVKEISEIFGVSYSERDNVVSQHSRIVPTHYVPYVRDLFTAKTSKQYIEEFAYARMDKPL